MEMEQAFLDSICENPDDPALWLILGDWLEERDDPRLELVRLTQSLRHEPDHPDFDARQRRVQALLAGGMKPLAPTITNSLGMMFALIPAGSFLMGSAATERFREQDEDPPHRVVLSRSYFLGVVPVTQRQYRRVVRRNPSLFHSRHQGGPQHPVERVTHTQASAFCRLLAELPQERSAGRTYRLPTEAEWEHACRAGTTTRYHCGDVATDRDANMDFHDSQDPDQRTGSSPLLRTCPVGNYAPNAWGLYDMHGNLWEWCQDWFDAYPAEEQVDPRGPTTGDLRVIRGGGWNSYPRWCRSARRSNTTDDTADGDLGFRVVCEVLR